MRSSLQLAVRVGLLLVLGLPQAASPQIGGALTGRGIMLPLQNYVGDEALAQAVESYLGLHFSNQFTMADPEPLRNELRRLRVRAPARAEPATLASLAEQLQVSWFAAAAIHEAVTEPTARITVSIRVFRVGSDLLEWAAVESVTERDSVPWFGIYPPGGIVKLTDEATARLASRLSNREPHSAPRPRFGRARGGYLRDGALHSTDGRFAVVPLDSSAPERSNLSIALATVSLEATLLENGFTVIHPGEVAHALRLRGKYQLGQIDPTVRTHLAESRGVRWMMTGSVEAFDERPSNRDGPWVAVSARVVDADSGSIVWMCLQDRQGVDGLSVFEQGIIRSSGRLTQEIGRSLVASFSSVGRTRN